MKTLYPYQQQAIDAIHSALKRGIKNQLVVLPTGCGKTFMTVEATRGMGRILVICHTVELMEQFAGAIAGEYLTIESFPLNMGVIKADLFCIDRECVIASAQTLHRRLDRIPSDWFDVVICDECDLFLAKTFKQSVDHFTPKLLLGLTATPFRQDNMPLTDIFDEIVYEYSIVDAVKQGYLCKPDAIRVKTNISLDNVKTLAGEFKQGELSNAVNSLVRNNLIVNKYIEYCSGMQFIAFCVDVQHTQDLCEAFNEKGITCDFVVGDTELTPDRRKVVESFKNDEIMGLTNCMVLSVGFNHNDTGVGIMACPTKSRRKYIQQVGRPLRLKSEKYVSKFGQKCFILDIVDGSRKHKLINTELLDSELPLEDKLFISEVNRQKLIDVKLKREQQLNVVFTDEDQRVELLPLPRLKVPTSAKWKEPATPGQLKSIQIFGYDIENVNYTMQMCAEIFLSQPATQQDMENIGSCGYNLSKGMSVAEARAAYAEITQRDLQKK